jgi:hypothetical protein
MSSNDVVLLVLVLVSSNIALAPEDRRGPG